MTGATRGLVTIVLPARNEEAAIGQTLRALPISTLRAMGFETEVVVLDGHSTDRTAEIATQWGARVVPDRERGKGAAFRNGIAEFRGDYVVMLDADGTYAPDAIPRVVGPLSRNDTDVIMGHRMTRPGSMRTINRVGNIMLSSVATVLHGHYCPDLCTGLWGFRREALQQLPLESNGFGLEAEIFALTLRLKLRLRIVEIDYLPRIGPGKLSFGHDGLRIVRRLMRARFAPLRQQKVPPKPRDPTPHVPGAPEVHA